MRQLSDEILNWIKNTYTYDETTGSIIHKRLKRIITTKTDQGYIRVQCSSPTTKAISIYAHHIAWFLYYGIWPAQQLDHINRVRTDNRICNLRLSDSSINNLNRTPNRRGGIGITKKGNKFQAQCQILGGKQKYLGLFDTREEAIEVVRTFKDSLQ